MNDAQWVGVVLVAIGVLTIWDCIGAYKKRGIKGVVYTLKSFVDDSKFCVYLIVMAYGMLGGSAVTPQITEWATQRAATLTDALGIILIGRGIPLAWGIAILVFVYKMTIAGIRPVFKYSEQEKQWQAEDKANNKIRKWVRGLFHKEVKDEVH